MRFSELDGQAVGVWGAGAETRSFARHLRRRLPGARIAAIVLDDPSQPIDEPDLLADDPVVTGPDGALGALSGCALLVRSPGVSIHRPELAALRRAGVPAATATGLWLAERGGRGVIGVTGTKGKSTTASLAAHLLRAAGERVELAGNIGRPALDLLDEPAGALAVVELSSYQVADLVTGPETAVVINLYKEHVDWHGDEATYRAEKLRLLALPGVQRCVVNALDREVAAAPCAGAQRTTFGGPDGWHVTEDGGVARGAELVAAADELPLRGRHNAMNVCAALAVIDAAGLPRPALPAGLQGFAALPHRLQPVADRDGVLWVDDSISTTPESALAALDSYADRDVILLGGGLDRGQDYAALGCALADRDATVLGLPSTGERLVAAARAAGVPSDRALAVGGMAEAVDHARRVAAPGTVVLLSPAAPSYDSYKNFQERGEHFAALATG
ncbi:MAG TPA: UDP-N-acetylmuramoyl-L-alanine--D-glutamate ligase [Baekduia sp.]|nr:UDP-N-acetylmuramoyl-L-alanine--D-glutamate ligase [Baekduia sp.]